MKANNCYFHSVFRTEVESCVEGSYLIRPMVAMLPAWFRFAQCIRRYRDTREAFPHLANALKYSTSFFVVIFSSLSFVTGSHLGNTNNPYFYLWIIASILSSIFAYIWDVKMDWGLFDLKSKDNKFLREETVYSSNVCAIHYYSTFYHFPMLTSIRLIPVFLLLWHG